MSGSWTMNFTPYLPEDAEARLKKYVYHGEDRSLMYKYFWRPLCAAAVERLPRWLAPNVITVTALLLVIVSHLLFAFYMPNLTVDPALPDVPGWIFVYAAVSMFLYQFLDNLDGYQARRTKTSSPLGLLMDHGCDAFNCCVGSLSIASCLCCGPTMKTWIPMTSALVVFFFNTWEEYYRGSLVLPVVNAANEGIVTIIVIYAITAVQGPAMWLNTVAVDAAAVPAVVLDALANNGVVDVVELLAVAGTDGKQLAVCYNTLGVAFVLCGGVVTVVGNLLNVYEATSAHPTGHGMYADPNRRAASTWLMKHFPFVHALTRLLPLCTITVLANWWLWASPTGVYQRHPRVFCWTVGLLYTKVVIHLMAAHLCQMEFHPLRRNLVPGLLLAGHLGLTHVVAQQQPAGSAAQALSPLSSVNETILLWEFFALAVVTLLHLVVNLVSDTATACGVRHVFLIRPPLAAAAKKAQ
jgi:ethanolaminephosphotransferase